MKTINANELHAKDMADSFYRKAYESLESEFELINALLRARAQTPSEILKIGEKSKPA
jgi:hypothetical protein